MLSIVATFGLSLILQESVRMTFGPTPRRILPPIQGTFPIFGIDYEVCRLFAAAVAIAALVGFFLFLHKTKLGTWMRAVRHDRDTAVAMGIPAQRVYVLTFAIGLRSPPSAGWWRRRSPPSSFAAASTSCRSASWR